MHSLGNAAQIGRKFKIRYAMSRLFWYYGSWTLDTERFGQAYAEFRRCRLKDRRTFTYPFSLFLLFYSCSPRILYFRPRSTIKGKGATFRSISRPGTPDNLYTSRKPWEQKRRYVGR